MEPVATFPASDYVYVEVQPSQELSHWINGHVRAFEFFGGLPKTDPTITAAVDRELNDKGYIVPGLGDAGDRLYGTK